METTSALDKYLEMYKDDLYYVAYVIQYSNPFGGTAYHPITLINGKYGYNWRGGYGWQPYAFTDMAKFKTYEDAYNKVKELMAEGIIPKGEIGEDIYADYNSYKEKICISKRPIGNIIGDTFAEYLRNNKEGCPMPKYNVGDTIYCYRDGISKLVQSSIVDIKFENGKFVYNTDYYINWVDDTHFLHQTHIDNAEVLRRDNDNRPISIYREKGNSYSYSQIAY